MKKEKLFEKVNPSVFASESDINKKFKGTPFVAQTYYAFQTDEEMFLVMELCPGGTLFDYLRKMSRRTMNYDIVRFYIAEIIVALEFVHAKNVMYRDLKPENILIDIDGHIKLTDFGLSKQWKSRNEASETFWGSPEYLAPEMIFGPKHTRSIDFYTLGWLVYEVITGFPPFYSSNSAELGEKLLKEDLKFPQRISESSKSLIEWLWNKDPEKRPKEFSEVKNHIFFENLHWGKLAKREAIPPWIPSLYSCHFDPRFTRLCPDLAFHNNRINDDSKSVYLKQITSFITNSKIVQTVFNYNPSDSTSCTEEERPKKKNWLDKFDFESHPDSEILMQKNIESFCSLDLNTTKDSDEIVWANSENVEAEMCYENTIHEGWKSSLKEYNKRIGIINKTIDYYNENQSILSEAKFSPQKTWRLSTVQVNKFKTAQKEMSPDSKKEFNTARTLIPFHSLRL